MLQFDDNYFKSEYIDGFYVRESMKRYWACQIDVLEQIDEICRRHNIKYFAFYGTLLGAIRHKGFIPWDDDMDIAMPRADYMKFIKYAKDEFKDGVYFYNVYENAGMPTRVINGDKVSTNPEILDKRHGCPYVAGIDIFILDNVSKDEAESDLIRNIWIIGESTTSGLISIAKKKEDAPSLDDVMEYLEAFEDATGQTIERTTEMGMVIQIGKILDRLAAMNYDVESDDYSVMGYYYNIDRLGKKYPIRCFEEMVYVPFENTMIPVPKGYDEILKIGYGDYMIPVRGEGATHSYPLYRDIMEELEKEHEKRGLEMPKAFGWEDEPGENA